MRLSRDRQSDVPLPRERPTAGVIEALRAERSVRLDVRRPSGNAGPCLAPAYFLPPRLPVRLLPFAIADPSVLDAHIARLVTIG